MAETLVIEESKHEAIEEMYFWPAVRKLLRDGDKLADQAMRAEDRRPGRRRGGPGPGTPRPAGARPDRARDGR